jgi:hypothetical protein
MIEESKFNFIKVKMLLSYSQTHFKNTKILPVDGHIIF